MQVPAAADVGDQVAGEISALGSTVVLPLALAMASVWDSGSPCTASWTASRREGASPLASRGHAAAQEDGRAGDGGGEETGYDRSLS